MASPKDDIENLWSSIMSDDITSTNFILLVARICEVVEKVKNLSGEDKKNLAISFFKKIAKEKLNWSDEDINTRVTIVESSIEVIIMASKGSFNINKVVSCFTALFKKCC